MDNEKEIVDDDERSAAFMPPPETTEGVIESAPEVINVDPQSDEVDLLDGEIAEMGITNAEDIIARYEEIENISEMLHTQQSVDKATRVALEAYDNRDMLPHINSYTAEPSKINYDETREFVETVKVNIEKFGADALEDTISRKFNKTIKRLQKVPDLQDMTALAEDYKSTSYAILALKPPRGGNIESLCNDVLDIGVAELANKLNADVSTESMENTKRVFTDGTELADQVLCISRFKTQLFKVMMQGTLAPICEQLASNPVEVGDAVNLLVRDIHKIHQNPDLTEVVLATPQIVKFSNQVVTRTTTEVNTKIADDLTADVTLTALYKPSEDLPATTSKVIEVPSIIVELITSIDESLQSKATDGDNPTEDKNILKDFEDLNKAAGLIDQAVEVYVSILDILYEFTKKAVTFNKEFTLMMKLVIEEAQSILIESN